MSDSVITGSTSSKEGKLRYFNEKKKRVIENSKKFPCLAELCLHFNFVDVTNHLNNAFFNLASCGSGEEILESFEVQVIPKIQKFPRGKKRLIISKLRSTNEQSYKLFTEWMFYLDLLKNKNISSIEYENSKIGNHDFQIRVKNVLFDIELTSFGKGPLQEKIEEGFRMASEYILERIPNKIVLMIHLDLKKVPLTKEISLEEIRDFIIKSYNILEPIILIEQNGLCMIRYLGGPNNVLWDSRDMFEYYQEFGQRLLKLSKTETGKEFLKKTTNKDLIESSFESVIIGPAKYSRVGIHSRCIHPSEAETLRKEALINQLKRNLRQKITKGQLKGKTNPIIALSLDDFSFMDYWNSADYFGNQCFKELEKVIQDVFREEKESEILGVLLFEKELKKSRFVENPNLEIPKKILDKIELLKN